MPKSYTIRVSSQQSVNAGVKNDPMTPWQIVEAELKRRGLSNKWLADTLGVTPGAVTNWKNRGIPAAMERPVAEVFGWKVDQLAGLEPIENLGQPRPLSEEIKIPQFKTGGAMGNGVVLRDQPGIIKSWQVSAEWIQKNVRNFTAHKNLAIVTGFGDSMRPLFNPGDPLIIDTGVTTVDFDSIYFFRVADEGFIKRLQRVPGEGLVAISENKGYRDWTIREGMDFQVFGRVIKVWRGEDF